MRPIVCVYDGLWAICSEKWFAVPFLAELWAFKRNEKEKSLDNQGIFLFKNWRRGRDSNPRYAINVYTLSRRATSTTHPPLREVEQRKTRIIAAIWAAGNGCLNGNDGF